MRGGQKWVGDFLNELLLAYIEDLNPRILGKSRCSCEVEESSNHSAVCEYEVFTRRQRVDKSVHAGEEVGAVFATWRVVVIELSQEGLIVLAEFGDEPSFMVSKVELLEEFIFSELVSPCEHGGVSCTFEGGGPYGIEGVLLEDGLKRACLCASILRQCNIGPTGEPSFDVPDAFSVAYRVKNHGSAGGAIVGVLHITVSVHSSTRSP